MRWHSHQGRWTTAATAAMVALSVVIPGCRRVKSSPEENVSPKSDQALSPGTMRPSAKRPTARPTPPARPSSRRAKTPSKVKAGFKLFKSETYPPKPVPGCPKCGTKVPGRGVIVGEGKVLGYTIQLYGGGLASTYSILKAQNRIYDSRDEDGGFITIGSEWGTPGHTESELKRLSSLQKAKKVKGGGRLSDLRELKRAARWLTPGADVTSDGRPNLVVHTFSGGSWGSSTLEIFELAPRFKLIQKIDFQTNQGDYSSFMDLDKDGYPEIGFLDYTFAGWKTSPSMSPGAWVVLKYNKGSYRIATSMMRRPAPSIAALKKQAAQPIRPGRLDHREAPVALWAKMLDLIYTGHAKLARRFIDLAWPKGVKGKRQFLSAFRKRLSESPYWPAVRKMDGPI